MSAFAHSEKYIRLMRYCILPFEFFGLVPMADDLCCLVVGPGLCVLLCDLQEQTGFRVPCTSGSRSWRGGSKLFLVRETRLQKSNCVHGSQKIVQTGD